MQRFSARVSSAVVETLADEDAVCETKVDCDCDDDGDKAGPGAAGEVCDVADEPDEEEEEGDGFCIAVAVVFNQLWNLFGVRD